MSGRMDPKVERVARALAALDDHPGHEALLQSLRATLTAHDHWEKRAKSFERQVSDLQGREQIAWESHLATLERERAKTKRYRYRCPVTAEDVEAAGVTWAQCEAWLDIRLTRFDRGTRVDWKQQSTWVCTTGHGWDMAGAINIVAKHFSLDQWDILGEMAALTPEASP